MTPLRISFHPDSSFLTIITPSGCYKPNGHKWKILVRLLNQQHGWTSAEQFIELLWEDPDREPQQERLRLLTRICEMRRDLRGSDFKIVNRHGWGYQIRRLVPGCCQPRDRVTVSGEVEMFDFAKEIRALRSGGRSRTRTCDPLIKSQF